MSNSGGTSSENTTENSVFFQLTRFVEQMESLGIISADSMDVLLLELAARRLIERHGTVGVMATFGALISRLGELGPQYEMSGLKVH